MLSTYYYGLQKKRQGVLYDPGLVYNGQKQTQTHIS